MAINGNGNGSKIRVNLQSLIQALVVAVFLGGGGFLSISDIKKDAAEREVRLNSARLKVEKDLNERLKKIEDRTEKLLELGTGQGKDIDWIKLEIQEIKRNGQ